MVLDLETTADDVIAALIEDARRQDIIRYDFWQSVGTAQCSLLPRDPREFLPILNEEGREDARSFIAEMREWLDDFSLALME